MFAVRVTKKVNGEDDIQEIYRRYSDFHDLNMLVQEKVSHMHYVVGIVISMISVC